MTNSGNAMYMTIEPIDALCLVPGSILEAMEELRKLDASESVDEDLDDGGGGGVSQSVSGEDDDDWMVVDVLSVRAVVLVEEGRDTDTVREDDEEDGDVSNVVVY